MKKILLSIMVAAMVTGCSSMKKSETPTSSEATANGGTEKVESTAMDFSPKGSDSGTIAGLQTVHFEYDKSTLTGDEQKKLEANAEWLKKNADVKMLVEGHCDQRGSIEYNLSLGERRANAVKQMLQKLGVAADRLTTTSYGKEKLLATGDSEEEMAQNRRANFVPSKK
jgi:peptidoglycan-associated lipoprotein